MSGAAEAECNAAVDGGGSRPVPAAGSWGEAQPGAWFGLVCRSRTAAAGFGASVVGTPRCSSPERQWCGVPDVSRAVLSTLTRPATAGRSCLARAGSALIDAVGDVASKDPRRGVSSLAVDLPRIAELAGSSPAGVGSHCEPHPSDRPAASEVSPSLNLLYWPAEHGSGHFQIPGLACLARSHGWRLRPPCRGYPW